MILANKMIPHIPFLKKNKIHDALHEFGCVIVTDIFTDYECNTFVTKIVDEFAAICDIDVDNIAETWRQQNLPPQYFTCQFDTLVSHLPSVIQVKTDDRIIDSFDAFYNQQKNGTRYIISHEGIKLQPNMDIPRNMYDLPHTNNENNTECIRGYIVLTDSDPFLRVSTKSHKVFAAQPYCAGNLQTFNKLDLDMMQHSTEKSDGLWLTHVNAPKGSLILLDTRVINTVDMPLVSNEHKDKWLCIVNVTYRPKTCFSTTSNATKIQCLLHNRSMDLWSERIYKNDCTAMFDVKMYSKNIKKNILNSALVYDVFPLKLAPFQKNLFGF